MSIYLVGEIAAAGVIAQEQAFGSFFQRHREILDEAAVCCAWPDIFHGRNDWEAAEEFVAGCTYYKQSAGDPCLRPGMRHEYVGLRGCALVIFVLGCRMVVVFVSYSIRRKSNKCRKIPEGASLYLTFMS